MPGQLHRPVRQTFRFINSSDGQTSLAARGLVRSHAAVEGWIAIYDDHYRASQARVTAEDWLDEDENRLKYLCGRVGVAVPEVLAASEVDPFDSLPIPPSPFINMLLFNFLKRWLLQCPELGAPATLSSYTYRNWNMIKTSSIAITTHLWFSAVVLYVSTGLYLGTPTLLQLKDLALRLVNQAVANNACSDDIILSIIAVCISESFGSGGKEILAHMAGIKKMVALRGGIDKIGDDARRNIYLYDKSFALTHQIPRSFPQHDHDDIFKCQTLPDLDPSLRLQHGFDPLLESTIMHESMVTKLLRFQAVFEKLQAAYPSPSWKTTVSIDEWNQTQSTLDILTPGFVLGRLNNCKFPKPYDIGECTRLATLRLSYYLRHWCFPGYLMPKALVNEIVTCIITHVKSAVEHPKIESIMSSDEARAFWWIICILGCCSRDARLLRLMDFLRTKLDIQSPGTSIRILEDFFYSRDMFEKQHDRLWAWLTDRRRPIITTPKVTRRRGPKIEPGQGSFHILDFRNR